MISAAEVTLDIPYTGPLNFATVSIVGAGKDGRTTYVAIPLPEETGRKRELSIASPPTHQGLSLRSLSLAYTFAEGPTDFILPGDVVTAPALGGGETLSASLSCGYKGGQADCRIAAAIDGQKIIITKTVPITSDVFQAVGQTSLIGQPAPTGGALVIRPMIGMFSVIVTVVFALI